MRLPKLTLLALTLICYMGLTQLVKMWLIGRKWL